MTVRNYYRAPEVRVRKIEGFSLICGSLESATQENLGPFSETSNWVDGLE